MNDRELIEGTIEDIRQSLAGLRHKHEEIGAEIKAKEGRLIAWEARLSELGASGVIAGRHRNPKGANLRSVAGYLAPKIEGVAASQIRTDTGLPWSSIQRTLGKHADVFEEVNGLWRLRPEAAKKLGVATAAAMNGIAHAEE